MSVPADSWSLLMTLPNLKYDNLSSFSILVEDICELFAKAFLQFLKIKKLQKVYLVGHSFGAYHAINFAEK